MDAQGGERFVLTDADLAALASSAVRLEILAARVSDREAFSTLVRAVEDARLANDSISQLRARLTALGPATLRMAKEVSLFL
jgi:hypothetical protein